MTNGIPSETNGITSEATLLPCPFCGGEAQIHYDANGTKWVACENRECAIQPYLYRTKRTEAEAIEAWNTRACDQCEYGAVPMTEENMAEHGWVRKRTCRLVGTLYYDGYGVWYHELSCGHEIETLDKEPPSYCMDCGAKVMDA